MSITVKELAEACEAQISGGDPSTLIDSAADIISARHGEVTQLTHHRYLAHLEQTTASACLVSPEFADRPKPDQLALLICADPEIAFIKALSLLHPTENYPNSISPEAKLDSSVSLGESVFIAPFVMVGAHTAIGDNSAILAGAYIGRNVVIGKNCRIHPNTVVYDDTKIGDNVTIHAGAVIGADGFGYKFRNYRHIKVPQIGNVVIGDHVEIGANTCIDRGALGSTVIGSGSKIDNLVQIGHNNKIGQHVIMCGQVGVSGSCQIDDYVILAGSVGVADHVTIGQGAVVMARSGVAGNVAAGENVFGSPAKNKRLAYKEQASISKLPDMLKKVKQLEDKIKQLENLLSP